MKVYEVIFQDEYDNLYNLGFFKELKDSIESINDCLLPYNVKINESDLIEHPSSFNKCFDLEMCNVFPNNEEVCDLNVRGFIYNDIDLLINDLLKFKE